MVGLLLPALCYVRCPTLELLAPSHCTKLLERMGIRLMVGTSMVFLRYIFCFLLSVLDFFSLSSTHLNILSFQPFKSFQTLKISSFYDLVCPCHFPTLR